MSQVPQVASANRTAYESDEIVRRYADNCRLHPGEERILTDYREAFVGADLLDLGVGAGRTAGHLAELVGPEGSYLGVDYAAGMVAAASTAHPHLHFATHDARDLSAFAEESFDVVVFSFNGIDYVEADGRTQVLAEVHRVLRPGGLFVFSTHNREYARRGLLPWQGRPRPGRVLLRQSLRALRHLRRIRALRKLQYETSEFALVNDDAHDWSLLTYYISAPAQERQLHGAGFCDVEHRDQQGRPSTAPDTVSVWRYYLARRA